ncbi:phenylalanine 4-monooxygenase [Cognatishimia activa]|uniref:phenylalanine 4-monooxygenase n=1 Tax=Cognatishimia activa TaxID=1715691 RepID=A0A0P1ISM9_9RHOB|nr:phenylalanine 4-monooxygenase [Cognatishimia activa]CUI71759.1 Phenylalanine-4-hydroxylase [Cognatishimia activa]CUK26607.1 Phenylalanine-4-hydroxylase [Cognatishimia activa]
MPKSTKYVAKIPNEQGFIDYTPEEDAVWSDLYAAQIDAVEAHMARPYLDGLKKLNMPQSKVPQCPDISEALTRETGWKVQPVPALIGFDKFYGMLADRTFPAASFIRSREDFDYIEEPDIFHEIFGHTPLLTDPRFAEFSNAIGKAGLKAEKKDFSWLIRLYWFTIEFGLTRENGELKALGSGLASSKTELPHAVLSNEPTLRAFDIEDILRTPYRIDIHQPIYFVIEDMDELFAAADRDLMVDIKAAQAKGLFALVYPTVEKKAS